MSNDHESIQQQKVEKKLMFLLGSYRAYFLVGLSRVSAFAVEVTVHYIPALIQGLTVFKHK